MIYTHLRTYLFTAEELDRIQESVAALDCCRIRAIIHLLEADPWRDVYCTLIECDPRIHTWLSLH